jgi:hypothetical protein
MSIISSSRNGKMIKIVREKIFYQSIPLNALVKLTDIETHHEIMYSSNPNNKITIKKLNNERYLVIETGEIKYFNKTENRKESVNEVRVTLKKLRNLINKNFSGHINEKCFTLTYRQRENLKDDAIPMKDTKKLYKDFKNFIERVCTKFGKLEYLSIVEPQGNGSFHCHVLLKFKNNPGFIPGQLIEKVWGHGFVKVKRVNDYMGEYLSAYLTDLEYTEENIKSLIENGLDRSLKIKYVDVEGVEKRFIKGARLYLYPTGINLFRKSKGIIYPDILSGKYNKIKSDHNLTDISYKAQAEIKDDDKFINLVIHEQYKRSLKVEC